MLPWKANEKLIEALYDQLQAVVVEIEELKNAKQSNMLEAMKKMIVEAVVAELKAALLPDLIAEMKKTMNPSRPQGVV
jgi:tRNA C32,U32 (ribose-2'-O)-methylase TrmJ